MKRFSGKVIRGDQKGRLLGFPTINLEGEFELAYGVYVSKATTSFGVFKGALHYGPKPVFNDTKAVMEIHLLDFSGDLYGETVQVEVIQKLREIEKFQDMEALKQQIGKDVTMVREGDFF